MNRSVIIIKCVVFCIILFSLSTPITLGLTKAEVSTSEVPFNIEKLHKNIRSAVTANKDRRAVNAYHEKETKVAPWIQNSRPTNPDNAALLYYQAFLLRPEPNTSTLRRIDDVLRDGEPDTEIKTYLAHCLPMIKTVEIASRIPQCTWGIWHGSEPRFTAKDLNSQVNNIRDILLLYARTLAADGHYRAALESCLTVRRMAHHLSNSNNVGVMLIARSHDAASLRSIQYVLSVMPPDADILTWFRGQIAVTEGVPLEFDKTLQSDFKSYINNARTNPYRLRDLRNQFIKIAEEKKIKEDAQNLTDEQLLSRACSPFPHFFDSIFRVVDNEKNYVQKCEEIQNLYKEFKNEYGTDPLVAYVMNTFGVDYWIDQQYEFQIGHQAKINGIKTAIEVYLILVNTGQLPQKLPDYLPKDPFTGKSFVYEITDDGFAFRCQGKDFQGRGKKVFEFKVHKLN